VRTLVNGVSHKIVTAAPDEFVHCRKCPPTWQCRATCGADLSDTQRPHSRNAGHLSVEWRLVHIRVTITLTTGGDRRFNTQSLVCTWWRLRCAGLLCCKCSTGNH